MKSSIWREIVERMSMRIVIGSIVAVLFLAGCASPGGSEVSGASVDGSSPATATGGSFEEQRFEGSIPAGVGANTPLYSGCEGQSVLVQPTAAWKIDLPANATEATFTLSLEDGVATQLLLCVLGLEAGVQALRGEPPLVIDAPLNGTGEQATALVLFAGGTEPALAANAVVALVVQPRGDGFAPEPTPIP